jgi:hypothetical protein
MEQETMSTFKRKMIYIAQIFVVIFIAMIFRSSPNYTEGTQGLVSLVLAGIGGHHMNTIGRHWGWGLFAATGLGALIILCIPPKPVLADRTAEVQ